MTNSGRNITSDQPLSILLVEDNPAHAELVMRSFEELSFSHLIEHVNDGEQALNFLTDSISSTNTSAKTTPDIILLDLKLPKMNGLEVLEVIKADACLKKIPVIVLTTSYSKSDIDLAYKQHVNSYLVKPVKFEAFSNLINDLGYYWLNCNLNPSSTETLEDLT